jgi:hypothetical protein
MVTSQMFVSVCDLILFFGGTKLLRARYAGEHPDLWSTAVVLVAMLVGALPWNVPSLKCAEWVAATHKRFLFAAQAT